MARLRKAKQPAPGPAKGPIDYGKIGYENKMAGLDEVVSFILNGQDQHDLQDFDFYASEHN